MRYEVGYLYQRGDDGRSWANGHGPIAENLRIVGRYGTLASACWAGKQLIGSPSPMGTVSDAYVLAVTPRYITLLGSVREDGTLDRGYRGERSKR